jgi:cell division protein FtsI/penicillin-binding protein 2
MEGATAARPSQPAQRRPRTRREAEQARRRRNRLLPLVAVAAVAFVFGVIAGAGNPEKEAVEKFIASWTKQDFQSMHDNLSGEAKSKYPFEAMASDYLESQRTATATAIDPGSIEGPSDGVVTADIAIRTRIFGVVDGKIAFGVKDGKINWEPQMTFPGLGPGEVLGRRLELGARAPILAADGTPLAEGQGADRSSPLGSDAIDVVGETGQPDSHQAAELQSEGYPSEADIGISGLERAFNTRLAGTPGGQLLAVQGGEGGDVPAGTNGRALASANAKPGEAVKSTVDPGIQRAAVAALAGRAGGAVVLDARSGDVKALAGSAYSFPAPPGSTFKIITATAALEQNLVNLGDTFDVVEAANIGGREISNSHDQACGGTFLESFAKSCNTVFAPLGLEMGIESLAEAAERFGFNERPELFDAAALSEINPPSPSMPTSVESEADLAVTAIGQGRVLATPLSVASMAQTIATGGKRFPTNLVTEPALRSKAPVVTVTDPATAGKVKAMMVAVINSGTGSLADLGKIQVAGKTGTAELGEKPKSEQPEPEPLEPGEEPPDPEQILDAWFTAFAPAQKPRYVVATFLIDADGDGGEVAAPMAREILSAAL